MSTPADPLREALTECASMLNSARLIMSDPVARELAGEAVAHARAALATKPAELPASKGELDAEYERGRKAGITQCYDAQVHPTESAGKSPEAVDEARIEAAYWEFDARHKGYSPFTFKRSERDAFKQTIRRMLNGGEAIP